LFIPWHFPLQADTTIQGASKKAEQAFKKQYLAIYNHLLQYKKALSNRNKAETGIRYEWYALQRWGANYWEDFYKQKIVWKRVGSIIRFCIDTENCVTLDSTCFATGRDLKYLVGILNSKLGNYMLQNSPKTGTGDLIISVQAVEPIKIPYSNDKKKILISNIVDKLTIDESNILYSNELNSAIYEAYGLCKDEIEFIESL
jgi:hypothetical protein